MCDCPCLFSRYTLGDLGDIVTNTSKQLPSFPISFQPNASSHSYRESSPSNKGGGSLFSSSPTNSLTVVGRRSPNHEVQMDAIAEDTTEDSTTPTNIHPPAIIQSGVGGLVVNGPPNSRSGGGEDGGRGGGLSTNVGSNGSFQGYPARSTTPVDETRQRRTGAHMLKSPVSPQMMSAFLETDMCNNVSSGVGDLGGGGERVGEDNCVAKNGLHQLLSQPPPPSPPSSVKQVPPAAAANAAHISTTSQPQVLLGMLQTPVYNTLTSAPPHPVISSEYIYSTSNYHMQTTVPMLAPTVMTSCSQSALGASELLQMHKLSNNYDVLVSHISSVLDHSGISYMHQKNVFSVHHLGVHFQIHITNKIQLQLIAGDAVQYQSLCTHLFSRLAPSVQ